MPAVKVFNIFGGQKPSEKRSNAASPTPKGAMQKFYRTFSVSPESSTDQHKGKVTAIAACLEKKIGDSDQPLKISSENVQKFLNKLKIHDTLNNKKTVNNNKNARHPVYENVNVNNIGISSNQLEDSLEENKGYSSIYENITILGVKPKPPNLKDNIETPELKLNKALESFDKILSEFSSTSLISTGNNFVPPKLQKSKTCSIIESRCILKKTISDPQSESKSSNKVVRNNSIDKTTSLWNLDDMKGKELTSPLVPFTSTPNEKTNADRYATYKISSKPNTPRLTPIKTEDLKKMDVKTRILKKTLSNPPSTPVPVVSKSRQVVKKPERKVSDPKKAKNKNITNNASNVKDKGSNYKETPKSQMQKAKSVWEIGNEIVISSNLERTRSSTSITGSPSKIPVIRSVMSQNKFSSTRALFSPTPLDLNNVDQGSECAQKKKINATRKITEKPDITKPTKQKSQLNLKSEIKRSTDKTRKESVDKKPVSSPKTSMKDYSEELNAIRTKIQQRKIINKRESVTVASESKRNENETDIIDSTLSPVKSIVKKIELKKALDSKAEVTQFVSCKVIPAVHKELCVANTTFHNHLSTLVGRQVKYIESIDDIKTCSQDEKLSSHKQSDEKISDAHSDCSDDSGHVSNDAANDNDAVFDNVTEMTSVHVGIDEVDCKLRVRHDDGPKQFGIDISENAKAVAPIRPARRSGRNNEVASGTRGTDAPKVDEQVRDTVYISISTICAYHLSPQVFSQWRGRCSYLDRRRYHI